jgi:hypothetical protein
MSQGQASPWVSAQVMADCVPLLKDACDDRVWGEALISKALLSIL